MERSGVGGVESEGISMISRHKSFLWLHRAAAREPWTMGRRTLGLYRTLRVAR